MREIIVKVPEPVFRLLKDAAILGFMLDGKDMAPSVAAIGKIMKAIDDGKKTIVLE